MELDRGQQLALDKNAGNMETAADEYIDPSDGLLHCKKCKGSRQIIVPRFGDLGYFMPLCLCPRQQKAQEERKAMVEQREDFCGCLVTDKEKSTEKIDGAIATIMALDRAIRCGNTNSASVYDERGILFL